MFINDIVYINADDVDSFKKLDLTPKNLLGKVKRVHKSGEWANWDATMLSEGTSIYSTSNAEIVIAKSNSKEIPYHKLVEG